MKAKLTKLTGANVVNSKFADYQTMGKPEPAEGLVYSTTGPFTNIEMTNNFIIEHLLDPPTPDKKKGTIVIDYSSPNISKELHVGHLRSTLIGDCIANVLAKLGYDVIKQNHIGDKKFTAIIGAAESLIEMQKIYNELNIGLTLDDIKSESSFDGGTILHMLPVCSASDGHKYIVVDDKEVVLKKQNGEDTYFLTDLTALYYRLTELAADKVIYVTDFRQKDHFKALFETAVEMGWAKAEQLVHVTTGCVLGKDGKPLKTRDGDSPLLKALISAAVDATSCKAIGIGVLKYAEYSVNKATDYVFDLGKATGTKGNTSVYIQYTCARIKSLLGSMKPTPGPLVFKHEAETALAKQILKWVDVLDGFDGGYKPSDITTYLFSLAKAFSGLYEAEKIIGASNQKTKMLLCAKCLDIFEQGFALLGIDILEKI